MMADEKYTIFFGKDSPFSQHHPCKFKIGDVTYNCAEQYMMHQKAVLFGDKEMARQILETSDPKQQKKLGRKVQNFVKEVWNKKSKEVVKEASMAKFSQNPDLLKAIKDTEGTVLVEGSPRDRLWGIGLGKNNPKAHDKKNWRGKNLLGYILTDVRNALIGSDGDEDKFSTHSPEQAKAEGSGATEKKPRKSAAKVKKIGSGKAEGVVAVTSSGMTRKSDHKVSLHGDQIKAAKKTSSVVTSSKDHTGSEAEKGGASHGKKSKSSNQVRSRNKHETSSTGSRDKDRFFSIDMGNVVTDADPDRNDGEVDTVDKYLGEASGTSLGSQAEAPEAGDVSMDTEELSNVQGPGREADSSDEEPPPKKLKLS